MVLTGVNQSLNWAGEKLGQLAASPYAKAAAIAAISIAAAVATPYSLAVSVAVGGVIGSSLVGTWAMVALYNQ